MNIKNRAINLFLGMVSASLLGQFSDYKSTLGQVDGMPISNFAVAANISEQGEFFNGIAGNPGTLGQWLENRGKAVLGFQYKGRTINLSDFPEMENHRQFPISNLYYSGLEGFPIVTSVSSWAPCVKNDYLTTALPVIMTETTLKNNGDEKITFDMFWATDEVFSMGVVPFENSFFSGVSSQYVSLATDHVGSWDVNESIYRMTITLMPNEEKNIKHAIVVYDVDWVSSSTYSDAESIANYAYANWKSLKEATQAFDDALPTTEDKSLNTILRWYMVPGMILTKCTDKGEVLTMGYNELNQRDSYWTSWIHLVFYPVAERIMLEESIEAIKENGKIPTTILPKIERLDDLDINAFFILRFFRYVDFHKDFAFAQKHWRVIVRAMDWLIGRDTLNEGLPQQISYWGDWKDIPGVQGRKYSPFTAMLYLASLQKCGEYAQNNQEDELAKKYNNHYKKGIRLLNKKVSKGGLWAGSHYKEVWYDGRKSETILQDQTIGAFFNVIDRKRSKKIFETLNNNNLTAYGIAETFPYYPSSYGYKPGEYHNGGVWPWLSFMDIWSRVRTGRKEEAIALLKRVAQADLFDSKDFTPNEHINSINGKNLGVFMQGWNAALFGLFYFEDMNIDK
jgi:uncharacterized protein (DUF608 family)